jgi:hypothetical protein
MTLRQYLFLMSLGTLICTVAWLFVIFNIDPNNTDTVSFVFFYASLFLSILGIISVVSLWIKVKFLKSEEVVFRHVKRTFRQGAVSASLVVLLLLLQQYQFLTWWNLIILVVLGILIEAIIFSNRKFSNRDYV